MKNNFNFGVSCDVLIFITLFSGFVSLIAVFNPLAAYGFLIIFIVGVLVLMKRIKKESKYIYRDCGTPRGKKR